MFYEFRTYAHRDSVKPTTEANYLKGFITYAHEDEKAKDELRKRLAVMEEKKMS